MNNLRFMAGATVVRSVPKASVLLSKLLKTGADRRERSSRRQGLAPGENVNSDVRAINAGWLWKTAVLGAAETSLNSQMRAPSK
jgi:hypothetical protein